ncbi:TPA: transketolase family protein [Candidatus Woesearchaeota archaeon]|nr:transketolase family protein [Candidatus Woesearchaeota archaeon]
MEKRETKSGTGIKLAKQLNSGIFDKPELGSTRDGFGEAMLELGAKDKRVWALCADLTESVKLHAFQNKFPERFVECGVAEQNTVTVASGLAAVGKIPYAASFATFIPGRCWEQIRTTICYNDVPVKIVGGHAGITTGDDGATHQAIEDIATMRAIPNMVVVVPCDKEEMRKATIAAANVDKPVYLRMGRDKVVTLTKKTTPFKIGKAEIFVEGKDVVLVACGRMVYEALVAARELADQGISAKVINCHTVKPLDSKTLVAAAKSCGAVVTCEEHNIMGGLGGAVAELLSEECPVPIVRVGVRDVFGESGKPGELMKKYGLTSSDIAKAARKAIGNKRK